MSTNLGIYMNVTLTILRQNDFARNVFQKHNNVTSSIPLKTKSCLFTIPC